MARQPTVFFSLCSEGMGHATRALPVIHALQQHGYRVEVFCGGRVAAWLRSRGLDVHEIFHIKLEYENNKLEIMRTVAVHLPRLPGAFVDLGRFIVRVLRERPVAIVNDFEAIGAWTGWLTGSPVVLVGNNNMLRYGRIPAPRNDEERKDAAAVLRATWWNSPVVRRNLITSFFTPPLHDGTDHARVRYAPCAVRPEVLARRGRTSTDGPVLVYQTTSTNRDLPGTLADAARRGDQRFVVYGMGRTDADADGRVQYRAFSEDGFLDDLAAAPFVMVNGGHSTIVEALALGKPVLSEPIRRQYEQIINARGLEEMGIGRGVAQMSADAILSFAAEAPAMRDRVAALRVVDNDALFATVEAALWEVSPRRALPPRPRLLEHGAGDDVAMAAE